MNLASFIMGLVGPIAVKGIIALGFTAVTVTGVNAMVNQLVTYSQSQWSSIPNTVMQLASISGIPEAMGMLLGAYVSVLSIKASMGFSKYVLNKG